MTNITFTQTTPDTGLIHQYWFIQTTAQMPNKPLDHWRNLKQTPWANDLPTLRLAQEAKYALEHPNRSYTSNDVYRIASTVAFYEDEFVIPAETEIIDSSWRVDGTFRDKDYGIITNVLSVMKEPWAHDLPSRDLAEAAHRYLRNQRPEDEFKIVHTMTYAVLEEAGSLVHDADSLNVKNPDERKADPQLHNG